MRIRPLHRPASPPPTSALLFIATSSGGRVLATFVAYEELHASHLPVALLALLICGIAALLLLALERPWRHSSPLPSPLPSPSNAASAVPSSPPQNTASAPSTAVSHVPFSQSKLLNVVRSGGLVAAVAVLFLAGLRATGPVRATLSDAARVLVVSGLGVGAAGTMGAGSAPSSSGPKVRKVRAVVVMVLACALVAYDGSGTAPRGVKVKMRLDRWRKNRHDGAIRIRDSVNMTTRETLRGAEGIQSMPHTLHPDHAISSDTATGSASYPVKVARPALTIRPKPPDDSQTYQDHVARRNVLSTDADAQVDVPHDDAVPGDRQEATEEDPSTLRGLRSVEEVDSEEPDTVRSAFDFKGELGVVLVFLSAIVSGVSRSLISRVAVDHPFEKRHHAISMLAATAVIAPFALLSMIRWRPTDNTIVVLLLIRCFLCALMFFVIPFYAETEAVVKLGVTNATVVRNGYVASAVLTVVTALSFGYDFSFVLSMSVLAGFAAQRDLGQHGSHTLRAKSGILGLPDPDDVSGSLEVPTFLRACISFVRQSSQDQESLQLLNFLIFQAVMVFVESIYGLVTNSIGLISASADTVLCCVALFIGLRTIVLTRKKSDSLMSFGYHRLESLSGFVNGVLLIFVAFLVFFESVDRILEPQNIESTRVVVISLVSTVCNALGLVFFSPESRRENHNLQGAYLHIWANTLATTGLLISALLTESLAWQSSGNAVAVVVSLVIVTSAMPLLRRSAGILLLSLPEGRRQPLARLYRQLVAIDGVVGVQSLRLWELTPMNAFASARVLVDESVEEAVVRRAVREAIDDATRVSECVVQISRTESLAPSLQHALTPSSKSPGDSSTGILL